jgi:hypothetical protein
MKEIEKTSKDNGMYKSGHDRSLTTHPDFFSNRGESEKNTRA